MRKLLPILCALVASVASASWYYASGEQPISVLFVVGDPGALEATSEQPVYDWMTATMGYAVTLIDDASAAPSPVTQDAVLLSTEASAATTKYNTTTVGVVVMCGPLANDMRLHASDAESSSLNRIYNLATAHYIVQDFTGSANITYAASVGRGRFVSTTLAAGVIKLAQSEASAGGTTERPTIVKAAAGATLTSGTAEGRRVFWGVFQFETAGANAKTLLQRMIEWCSGEGAD